MADDEVDLDSVLIGDLMDVDLLMTTDDFGIYETIRVTFFLL